MKRRGGRTPQPPWRGLLRRWFARLVLSAAALLAVGWALQQLRDPQVLPVKVVGIEGEIRYLDRQRLEQAVVEAVRGNFFTVDLLQVRDEVERLAWVDSVTIRRVWPDTLKVRVVEQQPLARWGQDALLNRRGEIFRPRPLPSLPPLAVLEGEEQDAQRISQEFRRIQVLLRGAELEAALVRVDARRAWMLQTRDGLQLNLGRYRILPRLSRFVRLYPRLHAAKAARLKAVDLRYTNGFSVRWEAAPGSRKNGNGLSETGHERWIAGN